MLSSVSADDWSATDVWWDNFRESQPLILAQPSIREMPDVASDHHWRNIDSLWKGFEADQEVLFAEEHVRTLSDNSEVDAWTSVDHLWSSYAGQQQDDLLKLQELMADLREMWADGASQFDDDPLTANWQSKSQYEGPLRTTINEEDWSQWLAHLLRTSSGPFVSELLGTPERSPSSVRREVVFFGENSERRVDILVEYKNLGVSIEVKKGDPNYGKTPETASLVERNDYRDWSHILLLQNEKLPQLQQTFHDDLVQSDEGSPIIQSDQSSDIDVRYWQDVSRLLRRVLLEGCEPDSHWVASAYLFTTLIEQRILGLHSFSFVDPVSADTGTATDIHRLVVAEPEVQIDYLRAVLHEDPNYE